MDQKWKLIFFTFWVIWLWGIRIWKHFWWFKYPFSRYGPPKMQKRPNIHQKWQDLCSREHKFWIKSVNRTFFLWEMGIQKREIRPKWPQMNQKWPKSHSLIFFVFLGNSTMENTNFNPFFMISWSITEIRVPENAKKTKTNRKWTKNESWFFSLFG